MVPLASVEVAEEPCAGLNGVAFAAEEAEGVLVVAEASTPKVCRAAAGLVAGTGL